MLAIDMSMPDTPLVNLPPATMMKLVPMLLEHTMPLIFKATLIPEVIGFVPMLLSKMASSVGPGTARPTHAFTSSKGRAWEFLT